MLEYVALVACLFVLDRVIVAPQAGHHGGGKAKRPSMIYNPSLLKLRWIRTHEKSIRIMMNTKEGDGHDHLMRDQVPDPYA